MRYQEMVEISGVLHEILGSGGISGLLTVLRNLKLVEVSELLHEIFRDGGNILIAP
jgi:hypothetical protein